MKASKMTVEMRRVREKLKPGQNEFAAQFGFSPSARPLLLYGFGLY
jgi:hypothetical protein